MLSNEMPSNRRSARLARASRPLSVVAGAILRKSSSQARAGALLDGLITQPPWSDMPVVVLATKQAGRSFSKLI